MTKNKENNILPLSNELWIQILSFLDKPKDLLNFGETCRAGYDLAQEEGLWHDMNKRYFINTPEIANQRMTFIYRYDFGKAISSEIALLEHGEKTENFQVRLDNLIVAKTFFERLKDFDYTTLSYDLKSPLILLDQLFVNHGFQKLIDIMVDYEQCNPYHPLQKGVYLSNISMALTSVLDCLENDELNSSNKSVYR